MKKTVSWILLTLCLLCLLSSCFSANMDEPYRGNHDGIEYLYLEDRNLLILGGEGELKKSNRICSVSFFQKAEYLFIAKDVESVEEGILSPENVKMIFCAAAPSLEEALLSKAELNTEGFEEREGLPFSPIGHCPSEIKDECLVCGADCYYEYLNLSVRFCLKGELLKDQTVITEGKKRTFDREGILQTEGFDFLAGSIRYFKDNRMITGSADIDGVRYNFSSEGALHSSAPLDTSIPIWHIILIVLTLPVGACVAYGVYLIYKKKNAE